MFVLLPLTSPCFHFSSVSTLSFHRCFPETGRMPLSQHCLSLLDSMWKGRKIIHLNKFVILKQYFKQRMWTYLVELLRHVPVWCSHRQRCCSCAAAASPIFLHWVLAFDNGHHHSNHRLCGCSLCLLRRGSVTHSWHRHCVSGLVVPGFVLFFFLAELEPAVLVDSRWMKKWAAQ